MKRYIIHTDVLLASDSFRDGSPDELRVLLAIIARGGTAVSEEELIRDAHTTRPRLLSALALWRA